ncbi:hypothetical protein [Erythrobacter sp.]|jgi:hypothetical protein|uniref:hypothetical protein n=1 Tax=Erythrobacter sp. TaxID=1042 RepID=UPI002EC685B5|nr:hypothetical protein [Erythrobacter sp.]
MTRISRRRPPARTNTGFEEPTIDVAAYDPSPVASPAALAVFDEAEEELERCGELGPEPSGVPGERSSGPGTQLR